LTLSSWLFVIPLAPLVAAVLNYILGRWYIKNHSHWLSLIGVGISFIISIPIFVHIATGGAPLHQHIYTWMPAGDFQVPVGFYVDQLTALMLLIVAGIGFVVFFYSIGYMHGDPGYYRFFAFLALFVFSMLMLIMADNYLLMFFGWEGVGVSSYLLIGFWFRRTSAAVAAKKAFIVNRVGDLGFTLGIMFIFYHLHSLQFSTVFAKIGTLHGGTITIIALLLFAGAVGKSAQLPLFVWLPDAMEGPTPVSALMHAATMVTAGVFLVARSFPIFRLSSSAMLVVAIVGICTAFVAATIALMQFDIKKVIAYSTVSQLGYMMFSLGVGAWSAGIFHLMTHAFFKGLLFLGAGSVIHSMHNEQDMRRMGGLKKYMPITYWTFLIAAAANAGIIPLAGFWSKDDTIVGAWVHGQPVISVVALIAAFFTSLYMFRVIFLTFHGEEHFDHNEVHPHESPWTMTAPMIVLAIGSAIAGFAAGFPPEYGAIDKFLDPVFTVPGETVAHASTATLIIFAIISTIIAFGGVLVTYLAYIKKTISPVALAARYKPFYELAFSKWYFDEIYEKAVVHPAWVFSHWLWHVVDQGIIDGTVNGVAWVVEFTAERWRRVQTGLVSNYAFAIALGAVVIVGLYLLIGSNLIR